MNDDGAYLSQEVYNQREEAHHLEKSTIPTERHFTACASLAALGVHVSYLDVFGPIRETVSIWQKTVKHSPTDKLYDAFISLHTIARYAAHRIGKIPPTEWLWHTLGDPGSSAA